MSEIVHTTSSFVDRRRLECMENAATGERRQFVDSSAPLSPELRELKTAVDQYKWRHHRRVLSWEEILAVIKSLGYSKTPQGDDQPAVIQERDVELGNAEDNPTVGVQ